MFKTETFSQRTAAILAGLSIIIMALCAGFSFGFIHNKLIVMSDATITINNISQSTSLFRAEIFGWLLILLLDVVTSWALYVFLKPVDENLSLLVALLRIFYAIFLGIAITYLILITLLVNNELTQLTNNSNQIMLYLNAFDRIWSLGLILFGLHLLVLAYLVLKSTFIPKLIGVLLVIAASGYILIHSMNSFLPAYENVTSILEKILSIPMAIGELSFAIWLLIKGGKIKQQR